MPARQDHVDAHVGRPPFARDASQEPEEACLGGRVGRLTGSSLQRREGPDEDHGTVALGLHDGARALQAEKGTGQGGGEDSVPGFVREAEEQAVVGCRRVTDQHVQPMPPIHRGRHHRGDVLPVPDVSLVGERGATRVFDSLDRPVGPVGVRPVVDDHASTDGAESDRNGAAEPTGGPGHQHHTAVGRSPGFHVILSHARGL